MVFVIRWVPSASAGNCRIYARSLELSEVNSWIFFIGCSSSDLTRGFESPIAPSEIYEADLIIAANKKISGREVSVELVTGRLVSIVRNDISPHGDSGKAAA